MKNEILKIDLSNDWIVHTNINQELLKKYLKYPVRLKCEILLLCMGGEVEATINTNLITARPNDLVILTPGSVLQIHRIETNSEFHILGFSQQYMEHHNSDNIIPETLYAALGKAKLTLKQAEAKMIKTHFIFLQQLYSSMDEETRRRVTYNIYLNAHTGISILYKHREADTFSLSKNEQLCRTFAQLVFHHYIQNKRVAWYAEKLGVTQVYLCTIVKQVTGKTCTDFISYMVIMDAKSQLKLSKLSIQQISDSLNFPNISFFSRYFKRYTGMTPLEYRNKG
ncbi:MULTISPECIES: helix-turn-helix domain-containing protein [Bacteroides]|uniref:helix-turn-helix domain-containing protein n=1 Tax=Bacteroides TaxID=816 RepID=UPI00259C925D|nr:MULTISPECIES: helix-turn-helix domain-containing protein [Bacteroides]